MEERYLKLRIDDKEYYFFRVRVGFVWDRVLFEYESIVKKFFWIKNKGFNFLNKYKDFIYVSKFI